MRLDLYQSETALIAQEQSALLDEARTTLLAGGTLSRLEQNGVLHAIQVLVENGIGKAKQVPLSAYDSFIGLTEIGAVKDSDLTLWNAAIGLRNRIVHDYMNIDMHRVLELVKNGQYRFITEFLLAPITT